MNTARTDAARLRGLLVGATSATVAVAAHGLAGGVLPASPSVVFLVLCSAIVGAVASSPVDGQRRVPTVCLYLALGQVVGHYVLVFTSGHHHGGHWSPGMLLAHAVAAAGLAVLICRAERLFAAMAGALWRLVLVLIALRGPDTRRRPRILCWGTDLAIRTRPGSGLVTRGPPSFAA